MRPQTPDGYTLLLLAVPQAINVGFYGKLAVDLNRDIVPVAALSDLVRTVSAGRGRRTWVSQKVALDQVGIGMRDNNAR